MRVHRIDDSLQDVETRINQQTHTADIKWKLEWKGNATFDDGSGETFIDKDFHAYLRKSGIEQEKGKNNEWFHIDGVTSKQIFRDFREDHGILKTTDTVIPYKLRDEQQSAVAMTPALYMQAAFRAQNPCLFKVGTSFQRKEKREVYELGTVAMIRGNNNSTFLLLAISEYDKDNIAHTSVDDLEMCIKSLLNFYDQHGQGHRLVIPLMGTNLSRAGLSHNDSLRVITSLFQLYGDKIHGEVDVVIYKGDKDKVTLDI